MVDFWSCASSASKYDDLRLGIHVGHGDAALADGGSAKCRFHGEKDY